MDAAQIKDKVRLLGEAGLRPYCIHIGWTRIHGSWQLTVQNHTWLPFGIPQAELLDWYEELKISEGCRPFRVSVPSGGAHGDYPKIEVSGGMRAPSLIIPLEGGEHAGEQMEALYEELQAGLGVYSRDFELAAPHNKWLRFCFSDWMTEEWHRLREADQRRKARCRADCEAVREISDEVALVGRKMLVKRPCGCETEHWTAPGKGRADTPSKIKFGKWLAERPCLACENGGGQ